MLPKLVREGLQKHLEWRLKLHERDVQRGVARVELPDAIERKYPRAAQELGWQFVFASRQLSCCPRTGRIGRHHMQAGSLRTATGGNGGVAALSVAGWSSRQWAAGPGNGVQTGGAVLRFCMGVVSRANFFTCRASRGRLTPSPAEHASSFNQPTQAGEGEPFYLSPKPRVGC